MNPTELIKPDIRYKDSFAAALREGLHLDPAKPEDILLAQNDFDAYMKKRHDPSRFVILPDGLRISRMPQTDLWLVKDGIFIGTASLRPKLNISLKKRGGNLGYAVRASERRKGYGSLILTLALPHAKAAGLEKILITCHYENIGSIKIIESHGGVLQDKIPISGLERRYWITL